MVVMRDSSGSALAVGRFAGWEPLGFEAGDYNWYRFVENGPTICTDPDGQIGVGPPHKPGGPLEPPTTGLRCKDDDACPTLIEKMMIYRTVIDSHIRWDLAHPMAGWPGGRHLEDILGFENGLRRCFRIYGAKCRPPTCPPAPETGPVPVAPSVPFMPGIIPTRPMPAPTAPAPAPPAPAPVPWPVFSIPPILIIPVWPTGPNGEAIA